MENVKKKKKKFNAPDAYIVLFVLIVIAFCITYIVPAGYFDVETETYMENGQEKERTVVDPESFQYLMDDSGAPQYLKGKIFTDYYVTEDTGLLNTMHNGFVNGGLDGTAGMIAFILIIGGSFAILIRTGAIDNGLGNVLKKMNGKDFFLIPVIMILFSLGGAVLGLGEELIPFAMILMPLMIRLGYDGITVMLTVYCSMMIGFATSWMNPFTLLIAQGIAGLPLMSGAALRITLYIVVEVLLFVYICFRIKKYKKDPTLALTYESDQKFFREGKSSDSIIEGKFTKGHAVVMLVFIAFFVWIFYGIIKNGYYIPQISAQFMGMGIACGIVGVIFKLNDMRINDIASAFKQGVSDMVPVVMILALAKGLTLILGGVDNSEPSVLNTILHYGGEGLSGIPSLFAAWGMYMFQSLFTFLVCSGPAQAAISMPIMAPLADLLGVTRQTSCLAFQMGDGFCNMINPTSALLMAYLGIVKIDYVKWIKYFWKVEVCLFVIGSIFMVTAVAIGY